MTNLGNTKIRKRGMTINNINDIKLSYLSDFIFDMHATKPDVESDTHALVY